MRERWVVCVGGERITLISGVEVQQQQHILGLESEP